MNNKKYWHSSVVWIMLCLMMFIELFLTTYLMKSSLGIDLFKHHSLGLWGWVNQHILTLF